MASYPGRSISGSRRSPSARFFCSGPRASERLPLWSRLRGSWAWGFVSYTMTHHTRQSALGLPAIVRREYGGVSYDITEYTMSEIIASVYDAMEETGVKRGMTRRWRRSSATPNGSDSASSGCLDLPRP